MYVSGLGLSMLGGFENHDGFDGLMLGWEGAGWHLELTVCRDHPVHPCPTVEDLLVLYLGEAWATTASQMTAVGFVECAAFNPWWSGRGVMLRDFDGYRTVLCREAW